MNIAIKLVASVISFFVLLLAIAAAIEVGTGHAQPATSNMILILVMIPVLYLIWRKR